MLTIRNLPEELHIALARIGEGAALTEQEHAALTARA